MKLAYAMSNVVSLHPHNEHINLYEVVDGKNETLWGGNNPDEAMRWFGMRQAKRMVVSVWSTTFDDAQMLGEPIDVTDLIRSTILKYVGGVNDN